MDSFYGGKPGISFIIRDKFDSIDDMKSCFKDGYYLKYITNSESNTVTSEPDTTRPYNNAVRYGEYCIIDTPNKNNIDNGKVYRRTAYRADQQNELQYAEYIGQIVGPAGGVPRVELNDIEGLKENFNSIPFDNGGIYYQTPDDDEGYKYTSATPATTVAANSLYINNIETGSMYKSGKDYYNTTTPTLSVTPAFKYGFYTFQNNTTAVDATELPPATLGIGFEIPYVDFATPEVKMQSFKDAPSITEKRLNDFYYKYTFNIPGGLPGGYFTNIKTTQVKEYMTVSAPTPTPTIYSIEDMKINPGSQTPYEIPENATPIANFSSPFVLTGNFAYPVIGNETVSGGWVTATESIYLGDVSTVQHMTVTYDNTNENYHLLVQYGGDGEDIGDYLDAGVVGPTTLGAYAMKLSGKYDVNITDFPYINFNTITPIPTNSKQGNLGVLAGSDITNIIENEPIPSGKINVNAVYYFIYENNKWNYLGNALATNSTIYNINTTLPLLNTENSNTSVELFGEAAPSNNNQIDDFGLELYNNVPTPTTTWSIPWK